MGVLALLAAGIGQAGTALPLYDGICLAAPYRYVAAPPTGVANGGTPGRQVKTDARFDPSNALVLSTDDNSLGPPQAQVLIGPGTLDLRSPATIRAELVPQSPTLQPATGTIIGNLYGVTISDDAGRPISLRPGSVITIVLLPPQAIARPSIERLDGNRWTTLATSTTLSCTNAVTATSDRLGTFAVVDPQGAPVQSAGAAQPAGRWGTAWLVAAAATGVLLVIAACAVLVHRRRGRVS